VHTMFGSFLPPFPHPLLFSHSFPLPLTPSLPDRNYFAIILILLNREYKQ
jgi:hypothetical protein